MSQESVETKAPKEVSPEAKKRKVLKEQIANLKTQIATVQKELDAVSPPPKPKTKIVLTETMKLAQSVGNAVNAKDENGKSKKTPSKPELRSLCSKIVGLNSANEITRTLVEKVTKEGLALLEVLPKDPPKPKKEATEKTKE